MKRNFKPVVITMFILMLIINFIGERGALLEDFDVPIALGFDLRRESEDEATYSMSARIFSSENKSKASNESKILWGEGRNIGEVREDRQLRSSKKFILGLEKALIISEDYARYGVENIIDILLNSYQVNDHAKMVICSGKAKNMLEYESKRYSIEDEVVGDMIEHAKESNFFHENYSFGEFIIISSSEGRNAVLPYIETTEEGIEITGMAIFDKNKMIGKIDIEDTRILNILRGKGGEGVLSLQKSSKEYINYRAKVNRKVTCNKEEEKYKFTIELNFTGDIVSNELYKDSNKNPQVLKEFQYDMERQIEKQCMDFINKIRENYSVDVLDIGKVAVGKYGRDKNVDWNKEFINSLIEVKAKVRVNNQGRGDY